MSGHMLDDEQLDGLAADIEVVRPKPHHAELLKLAGRIRPGCDFRHAMSRGGWYRPGAVIATDGTRLATSVEAWANRALKDCGGNFIEMVEQYADAGLQVTRHTGRTHYFVAPYGPRPDEFLQLEVEELQEVLDRELIDPDDVPQDMQELAEPISPAMLDAQPLGAPQYRFRRLLDVRQTVARARTQEQNQSQPTRLFGEWMHSSAAARGHFSDHWVVVLREYLDRYRNPAVTVSVASCHARKLKPFHWNEELSGVELSAQLRAFDRAAGYTSAWYFHLISGGLTPAKVAYGIARDLGAGFSYLPDSEAALIKSWIVAPYSV